MASRSHKTHGFFSPNDETKLERKERPKAPQSARTPTEETKAIETEIKKVEPETKELDLKTQEERLQALQHKANRYLETYKLSDVKTLNCDSDAIAPYLESKGLVDSGIKKQMADYLHENPHLYAMKLATEMKYGDTTLRTAFKTRFCNPEHPESGSFTELCEQPFIMLSEGPQIKDEDIDREFGRSYFQSQGVSLGQFLTQIIDKKISNVIALGHMIDGVKGSGHDIATLKVNPEQKSFLPYFQPGTKTYKDNWNNTITVISTPGKKDEHTSQYRLEVTIEESKGQTKTQVVDLTQIHVHDNHPVILNKDEISELYEVLFQAITPMQGEFNLEKLKKILIHCAAGRGRTGNLAEAFLEAVSLIMPNVAKKWFVDRQKEDTDELATVEWLRDKRKGAINTSEQFISSRIIAAQLALEHVKRVRERNELACNIDKMEEQIKACNIDKMEEQINKTHDDAIKTLQKATNKFFNFIKNNIIASLNKDTSQDQGLTQKKQELAQNIQTCLDEIKQEELLQALEKYYSQHGSDKPITENNFFYWLLWESKMKQQPKLHEYIVGGIFVKGEWIQPYIVIYDWWGTTDQARAMLYDKIDARSEEPSEVVAPSLAKR